MESLSFLLGSFWGGLRLLFSADAEVLAILWLSLKVAILSTLGATAVSIPIAWYIHFASPQRRRFFSLLFQVLVAIPTVIIGTLCFLLLSRNGPLGALELLYTPTAIILGDLLLAIPLITLFLISALHLVPAGIIDTARNLGASRLQLVRIVFRECQEALLVAVCTAFGRVISEVGAAMILGGNIRGLSRTMTTAISLEIGRGETELALALGIILLLAALANAVLLGHSRPILDFLSRPSPPGTNPPRTASGSASATVSPAAGPIRFQNLCKSFDGLNLFPSLEGEICPCGGTSLQGRSGCGKTTLLKLIAGLEKPDQGVAETAGRVVLVFQRPYLFHGTVWDNLLIPSHLQGKTEDESRVMAWRMAETLEISHLLSRSTRYLSAGEAARVSLGRALAASPDLLLIDETLVHLDTATLKPIKTALKKFLESGGGFLLVTHQPEMAQELCSRHFLLADGKLSEASFPSSPPAI